MTNKTNTLKIDKIQFMKNLENVNSWEDWDEFEEKYFQVSQWPDSEEQLNRQDMQVGDTLWTPIHLPYDIPAELYEFNVCVFSEIFAKLEPEVARDNYKNPERYYKYCCYCKVSTDNYLKVLCDFCGSRLLKDVQPGLQKACL